MAKQKTIQEKAKEMAEEYSGDAIEGVLEEIAAAPSEVVARQDIENHIAVLMSLIAE